MSQPIVPPMPACGDHGALQFNPTKPCNLHCFFDNLKFQFAQSHVVDKEEMKGHAMWFVDCNTAELWEILLKFTDATALFQKFVNTEYKLYLGSNRAALADSGHEKISRRDIESRDSINCQPREILQRINCNHYVPYCQKSHHCC